MLIAAFTWRCASRARPSARCAAIKSNQNRLSYTGVHTRTTPSRVRDLGHLRRARGRAPRRDRPARRGGENAVDRLGRGFLMNHPGRRGHPAGPFVGAVVIRFREHLLVVQRPDAARRLFLPAGRSGGLRGEGGGPLRGGAGTSQLGMLFMLLVIFLPGGVMEGVRRIGALYRRRSKRRPAPARRLTPADSAASSGNDRGAAASTW